MADALIPAQSYCKCSLKSNDITRTPTDFAQHTAVTETPATSIDDGFFTISTAEPTAGSNPYGYHVVNGVHIYDSTVLSGLFARQKKTWANTFWPHILTIQVVSTPNDTLLKFTMQHVAADVLGIYFLTTSCQSF
jgi:hypothetical protein